MTTILLATNNTGKRERLARIAQSIFPELTLTLPSEHGLTEQDVEETGATLAENAELKARAYYGMCNLPILATDTGLWLEPLGFTLAPKRDALGEDCGKNLTEDERCDRFMAYWQRIAHAHGGIVNGAWVDSYILIHPDGTTHEQEARREIILTDTIYGRPHSSLPVRALYLSKETNKPAVLHTEEEELREMRPIIEALRTLLERA